MVKGEDASLKRVLRAFYSVLFVLSSACSVHDPFQLNFPTGCRKAPVAPSKFYKFKQQGKKEIKKSVVRSWDFLEILFLQA